MDFSEYKFRCSALGYIVSKSGKLTETTKTYLNELHIGAKYGVQKEIASKYFDKGIACEQDGIKLLNKALFKSKFITKNKIQFENELIHGTPDVVEHGNVFDIKNAFDLFTFGKCDITHNYEWQVKGYLWLTDNTKGGIFYCLSDMPDYLFADEEKRLFYSGKFISTDSQEYQNALIELHKKYVYDYMQDAERFKLFPVELTDTDIKKIEISVKEARAYLQQLEDEWNVNIENNKLLLSGNIELTAA